MPVPVKVEMTPAQIVLAATVATMRQTYALKRGLKDRTKAPADPWDCHVQGAAAEFAVAKVLGLFWDGGFGTFEGAGGDVAGLQVRCRREADRDLYLNARAKPDSIYVLVVGTVPTFEVVGWIRAGDGLVDKYKHETRDRGAAWYVPQADLNDLSTLPIHK